MAKAGNYPIPFSPQTNQMLAYVGNSDAQDSAYVKWIPNFEFEDEMKFSSFERGRSAAHAIFESLSDQRKYQMFLTNLADAIEHFDKGHLKGKFTFTKKGTNYGVALIKKETL